MARLKWEQELLSLSDDDQKRLREQERLRHEAKLREKRERERKDRMMKRVVGRVRNRTQE